MNLDQYSVVSFMTFRYLNRAEFEQINFAGRPFYMFGILGFKVALCLAYLRILSHGQHRYRQVVWCVLLSCIVGHVAGTLILIFQCSPVSDHLTSPTSSFLILTHVKVRKSWLPLTQGSCLPNVATFYALAAITIFFDIVIFFLPIKFLLGIQVNVRRKAALIGVFLLGLFTTVCSILRMVQINQISKDGNSTYLVLWGTIEMNVGVRSSLFPTTYSRSAETLYTNINASRSH